jgi:hypothetical protein
VLHSRTKHIELRYHFLGDNVEKGNIYLIHVPKEKKFADILTKPLDQATFAHLRGELGVVFPFKFWLGRVMYRFICIFIYVSYLFAFASLYHRLHLSHMP